MNIYANLSYFYELRECENGLWQKYLNMLNILFQNLDIFSSIETANSISKKTFLIESRNKYLIKYFYKQNCENGL